MIRSMTGMGRVVLEHAGKKWIFEIRSLNHRYLELSLRMPDFLYRYETEIKKMVEKQAQRGKVSVSISMADSRESDDTVQINEKKIRAYVKDLRRIAKSLKIDPCLTAADLAALPNVFSLDKPQDKEKLLPVIQRGMEQTLRAFILMREKEGEILTRDLRKQLAAVRLNSGKIKKTAAGAVEIYKNKLQERIERLTEGAGLEPDRLAKEAAVFADRCDINEEIVRLENHLSLFEKELQQKVPVGKKLDFITQEMNREANTIGSKSASFDISQNVISIKSHIEKLREMIQNIE